MWPEDHPDQSEEYRNFTLPKPIDQNITSGGDDDPQEITRRDEEPCKRRKKKINKIHKRKRNKINKRLIPYYHKIKSRIQTCRIYFLKKYIKLLKTVVEIKNKELSFQTLKGDSENEVTLSRSKSGDRNEKNRLVQRDSQSGETAVGGDTARDAYHQVVRDCTTSFRVNLETHEETIELTRRRKNSAKLEMESEEAKLLKRFREKCERRDRNEERRRARIEHLKQMIAEIPSDPEDIPDEEERQIEEAIREAETQFNMREKARKIFRVREVCDIDGNEVAFINATISVKVNPTRMQFDRQGIMMSTMMKENKMKTKTQLLGDINVDEIINLQFEMQELPEEEAMEEREPQRTETNIPVAATGIKQTNVTTEVDEVSYTNLPEVTSDPCPVGMMEEVVQESEELPEVIQKTPSSEPVREKISRKRVRTYSRIREPSSDSTEGTAIQEG